MIVRRTIIALGLLVAMAAAAHPPRPVLDVDFADPFVLAVDGGLVAYATNTERGGRRIDVQISTSRDGRHWSAPAEGMPVPPAWARARDPDIWAPEAISIGSRYVLYFSARHATRTRPDGRTLCVGAAVANRPEGPFVPQAEPLTCGGAHGVIDASPLRDGADLWLYVKTDGNCCHAPTTFIAQRLSPDGLSLVGAPTTLSGVTNDARWEGAVIEAPEMRRHAGRYYLFFAGGAYDHDDYALGYALCDTPNGPCHAAPENPILRTRPGLFGPGHGCVFKWRGRTWLAIAAWRNGPRRYRAMYLERVEWVRGRPLIDVAR